MSRRTLPTKRRRRLWRVVAASAAWLLVLYVGAYAYLSRRGMAEAAALGSPYFFYCPVSDIAPGEELPAQHRVCIAVFDPINQLDRRWFGGGDPCRCVLWRLSR
jgi:hypothetical protein